MLYIWLIKPIVTSVHPSSYSWCFHRSLFIILVCMAVMASHGTLPDFLAHCAWGGCKDELFKQNSQEAGIYSRGSKVCELQR